MNKKYKTKIKKTLSEKIVLGVFFVIIALHAATFLYSFSWVFINALKTTKIFEANPLGMPDPVVWSNFKQAFQEVSIEGVSFLSMLVNSIMLCALTTTMSVSANVLVAYPLARYRFPGRNIVYAMLIFVLTVPLYGGSSIGYKLMSNLGMIDNPLLMCLNWFNGFASNTLILYGCFKVISQTYAEAAYLDGANEIQVFSRVMLPQARPSIAAVAILGVIGQWSNYEMSLIYLPSFPNLALGIFLFEDMVAVSKTIYFASVCITMLPVLIVFACCQKTIMSNFSLGGIKG